MKSVVAVITLVISVFFYSIHPASADFSKAQEAYLLKDYAKAIQEYQKDDDPKSMYMVGYMYDHGEGVPQDGKEAAIWYRKAAEKGLAKAQYRMGMLTENGFGVDQDLKEAERWYRRAAGQGFGPAKDALKKIENRK